MQRKFSSVQKLSMRDCSQLESMPGYGGTMAAANLCVPAFVCFTTSVELPSETTIIRTHQINDHTFIEGKRTLLRPPLACLHVYSCKHHLSPCPNSIYILMIHVLEITWINQTSPNFGNQQEITSRQHLSTQFLFISDLNFKFQTDLTDIGQFGSY